MKACAIRVLLTVGVAIITTAPSSAPVMLEELPMIRNGTDWTDTEGRPISAHDGGMLRVGDTFYWYGTSYAGNPQGNFGIRAGEVWNGVQVYSSKDLVGWKFEGVGLPRPKRGWLTTGTCGRPHVLYNAKTRKYVLWHFWHLNYPGSPLNVAVSDHPAGPFQSLGPRELGSHDGFGYDFGLFEDDDGAAYIAYCADEYHIRVDRLSDDYTLSLKDGVVALKPLHEAPAMIKYRGQYIIAASGVNGWAPTETAYAVASRPLGPYGEPKQMSEQRTWDSQLTQFVLFPETDTLMAMCDQWWVPDKKDLNKSRYLWIPVDFDPARGIARMEYRAVWTPLRSSGKPK